MITNNLTKSLRFFQLSLLVFFACSHSCSYGNESQDRHTVNADSIIDVNTVMSTIVDYIANNPGYKEWRQGVNSCLANYSSVEELPNIEDFAKKNPGVFDKTNPLFLNCFMIESIANSADSYSSIFSSHFLRRVNYHAHFIAVWLQIESELSREKPLSNESATNRIEMVRSMIEEIGMFQEAFCNTKVCFENFGHQDDREMKLVINASRYPQYVEHLVCSLLATKRSVQASDTNEYIVLYSTLEADQKAALTQCLSQEHDQRLPLLESHVQYHLENIYELDISDYLKKEIQFDARLIIANTIFSSMPREVAKLVSGADNEILTLCEKFLRGQQFSSEACTQFLSEMRDVLSKTFVIHKPSLIYVLHLTSLFADKIQRDILDYMKKNKAQPPKSFIVRALQPMQRFFDKNISPFISSSFKVDPLDDPSKFCQGIDIIRTGDESYKMIPRTVADCWLFDNTLKQSLPNQE